MRRKARRRRGHGQVTLATVARVAGVSTITVSRVIRDPDLVAEATRHRVHEAISQVGYIPNLLAGGLASNESRTIGAVVPTLANSIFAEMLQGMVDAFERQEYQLVLGSSNYDLGQEESLVRVFLAHRVAGIVLTGASHSPGTHKLLESSGVPFVETWSLLGSPSVGSVGFSNFQAAYELMRHLVERGYREIGFVSAPVGGNDRAYERKRGYLQALRDFNLKERETAVRTSIFSLKAGAAALRDILERQPETDAIFFANDTLAAGALLEAQRLGLSVPERVAIAGFDDLEISSQVNPSLTTVRIRRHEIGYQAAKLLLDSLSGVSVAEPIIDLGFEIVMRNST